MQNLIERENSWINIKLEKEFNMQEEKLKIRKERRFGQVLE